MNKRILKLALPAILNNITVPLLGLSDTAITGHIGSASYLAAMAVGSMMLNVIFWLCGFLRMGTTGLSSQAFGAGDYDTTVKILHKSLRIGLFISAVVLILQIPIEKLLFLIIAPDASVSALASLYFRICLWAAPAQLAVMAVTGWFIGLQNTLIPMIIAVGINVINIVMSVLLVFVFDCGFSGVAYGTLIANWIGLIGALWFVARRQRAMRTTGHEPRVEDKPQHTKDNGNNGKSVTDNKKFFRVNSDLFFRSACIMVVTLAMTSYGARLGETILAANAVIMQFFLFFSYFMDGFAFAGEAIVGSSYGAGDYAQLHKGVRILLFWGAGIATLFLLVYLFGSITITSWLTSQEDVREAVRQMKLWLVVMPPVTVAAFLFDGIFIGLARTRALLVTTLIASAFFFIIVGGGVSAGLFPLTNAILWLAFGIYLLLRGVLLAADYVKLQSNS